MCFQTVNPKKNPVPVSSGVARNFQRGGADNFGQDGEILPAPYPAPHFFTRKGGIIPPPRASQLHRVHYFYLIIDKKIGISNGSVYFD